MTPFLLEENSAIGLVINFFYFIIIAPPYIGSLVMLLSKRSRTRKRGMVLVVGLLLMGLVAGLMGLLSISSLYAFLLFSPLIMGVMWILVGILTMLLSGKSHNRKQDLILTIGLVLVILSVIVVLLPFSLIPYFFFFFFLLIVGFIWLSRRVKEKA